MPDIVLVLVKKARITRTLFLRNPVNSYTGQNQQPADAIKDTINHLVPPSPRRFVNAVIQASNTFLIFSRFAQPGSAMILATVSNGSGVFQIVAFPS